MVRWLHESGCEWTEYWVLHCAVKSGNIELTEWVRQQVGHDGTTFTSDHICSAVQSGYAEMCEYILSQKCPQKGSMAVRGTLLRLSMYRATAISKEAGRCGSVEVLEYLLRQGMLTSDETLTSALNAAGACDQLAAAQWLRQHGAEWPTVLRERRVLSPIKAPWSGDTLAWARAEGCTSPTSLVAHD
jgi:hypothetical protein